MSHYVINAWDKKSHINKEIYGHFSEHLGRCIYNGIFVGDDPSIPEAVAPRPFTEFSRTGEKLLLKILPCSVTHIVLK